MNANDPLSDRWRILKPRSYVRESSPSAVLSRAGVLRLTAEAVALIGTPDWVKIVYDPDQCAIGLKAARRGDAYVRRCAPEQPTQKSKRVVWMPTMYGALGLSLDDLPVAAPAVLEDDILVIQFSRKERTP